MPDQIPSPPINRVSLFGKTLREIEALVASQGWPKFTARQLTEWLYKKNVGAFEEMTNLSKKIRNELEEKFVLGISAPTSFQESIDGTKKYLFPTASNRFVESAYIPHEERKTLCVSSQVGCKMGCLFCMTGKQGFMAQLTSGEIVNQVRSLPERDILTNFVYMGMGEPFDNIEEVIKSLEVFTSVWGYALSPRRFTVSSIGVIPGMMEFLKRTEAHLAISLHSPFDEERKSLMPIQNVYPIHEVLENIKQWDFGLQRRVSFEYIMFNGVNDTSNHVNELARILHGISCRINLIRFHPIPHTPLAGSPDSVIFAFQEKLKAKGIITTIRSSRGLDIFAACGMLSTKALVKKQEEDF